MTGLQQFQEIIGYQFRDSDLLEHALIHSSYANEKQLSSFSDNERLEFLGDAVLELISSEYLYEHEPDRSEGDLSRRRAALVCEPTLAAVAKDIELGEYVLLGRGEASTGGAHRASILSDAFEAVIGAIYLDGGFEPAKAFVRRFLLTDIEEKIMFSDSKTTLQEMIQGHFDEAIVYRLLGQKGPDHAKEFHSAVCLGREELGRGIGSSKKSSEQNAAREAILYLKKHYPHRIGTST